MTDTKKLLKYLKKGFHHIYTQIMILVFAIFVLFSADLEILVFPHSFKPYFVNSRNFLFVFFLMEFTMSNFFIKDFFLSFYFLIDFIDLISLGTETAYIWNYVIAYLDSISRYVNFKLIFLESLIKL
jgi:hypothetical protein